MLRRVVQVLYERYPQLRDPDLRRVLIFLVVFYGLAAAVTIVASLK